MSEDFGPTFITITDDEGQEITLEFHKFLRPEQKFDSLEALREEIRRNADQTRAYFAVGGENAKKL